MGEEVGVAKPELTIGLLVAFGHVRQSGRGALTVSQIAIVEDAARAAGVAVRFLILGWRDPRPSYIVAPNVERFDMGGRELMRPGGLYAAARRCDLVLDIGAGDSFADIYGTSRIQKMLLAKFTVHAARRPMILSPQTIGPFTAGLGAGGRARLDPAPRGFHPRRALDAVPARDRLQGRDRARRRTWPCGCPVRRPHRGQTGRSASGSTSRAC